MPLICAEYFLAKNKPGAWVRQGIAAEVAQGG